MLEIVIDPQVAPGASSSFLHLEEGQKSINPFELQVL